MYILLCFVSFEGSSTPDVSGSLGSWDSAVLGPHVYFTVGADEFIINCCFYWLKYRLYVSDIDKSISYSWEKILVLNLSVDCQLYRVSFIESGVFAVKFELKGKFDQ